MSRSRVLAVRIRVRDKEEELRIPVSGRPVRGDVGVLLDPRKPERQNRTMGRYLFPSQNRECTLTFQGFTQLTHLCPYVGRDDLVLP